VTTQILIADDNESVLRGLRALLGAKPGWEICGDAVDGKEAVARATELRPDLIILDYAMPRLDGLSAAKEIHKLLPTVPIVLHTLYASTELDLAAKKHGIRRVVDKTKSGALISAVEELLSAPQLASPGNCGLPWRYKRSAPAMRFWDASSNGAPPSDRSVSALRRGIPGP